MNAQPDAEQRRRCHIFKSLRQNERGVLSQNILDRNARIRLQNHDHAQHHERREKSSQDTAERRQNQIVYVIR